MRYAIDHDFDPSGHPSRFPAQQCGGSLRQASEPSTVTVPPPLPRRGGRQTHWLIIEGPA
jgi:hypothetical protein